MIYVILSHLGSLNGFARWYSRWYSQHGDKCVFIFVLKNRRMLLIADGQSTPSLYKGAFINTFSAIILVTLNTLINAVNINITRPVWERQLSVETRSIRYLLMLWLLMSPDHQQAYNWQCVIVKFLTSLGVDCRNLPHSKWYKNITVTS